MSDQCTTNLDKNIDNLVIDMQIREASVFFLVSLEFSLVMQCRQALQ